MKILAEDMHALMGAVFAGGVTLKITSEPGAGKSKMAEAYAAQQNKRFADDGGYGCFVFDLSSGSFNDFMGYLMPKEMSDKDWQGQSQDVLAAKYTYPHWAYDLTTKRPAYQFKRGLIILEEWGQGELEVKKACAPLINDGRVGLWRFEGFDILVLSNRPEDRSGVTREFDFLINRWCEAELVATLKGFLVAGAQLGMTPLTLAFAARNEDKLFQGKVPEKQGPWLTQRSLHKFDNVIRANAKRGLDITDPLMQVVAAGTIGAGAAGIYMAFAEARSKIPTVSAIVADPGNAPVPSELDVLMFLVFDLASKTTRQNIGPIAAYVQRLSSGMQVTYFNAATQRDETLVSTQEFSEFAVNNITLLSTVAARR
jgi:hypothetical protein